jgi:hypothetical protein
MKLDGINSNSISRVSNQELFSIHRRIHQLRGNISKYKPSRNILELKKKLVKSHKIIVREINKRKFRHLSNLLKKGVTEMSKYLDTFFEQVVTEDFLFGKTRREKEQEEITIPWILEKKWIQKAIEKPGSLHRQLGVPEDEKIPEEKLEVKPSDSPKLKKRKILAKTLKKITRKRTGKGEEELEESLLINILNDAIFLLEKKKGKYFIKKAIEHPGALHRALGIPQGEKIPEEKLEVKPDDSPKMKKMKVLAKTLKKITRKRTGKGEEED